MSTTKRRRRKLKRAVYVVGFLILWSVYAVLTLFPLLRTPTSPFGEDTEYAVGLPHQVVLKDDKGQVISRNSSQLSEYFSGESLGAGVNNVSLTEASKGREAILAILQEAGIQNFSAQDVWKLPTQQQIEELYGQSSPIIVGLDTCATFRERVPSQQRFLGISGMFNSGTTAFGISLQANCRFPDHPQNVSNDLVTDVNVRDPYYWMHSMCRQGYGARWNHDSNKHCPNLVPNDYDRQRFPKLANASSVLVWMGAGPKVGPSWESLVHYWNDWYKSYLSAPFPRLLIRFEDTLFHGRQVMEQVCACGGGTLSQSYQYLVDEAKWSHKHKQNNLVSAMIQYGTETGRYRNMSSEDLAFAHQHLDQGLMSEFGYKNFPHDNLGKKV
eukprot:Nitzschia sp. Nitz4//scaffold227_size32659//14792//16041//NITZ4_007899-RA/size32659-processed-gene-0.26-mRNA-1//-1//CDS//3329542797//2567//frame0